MHKKQERGEMVLPDTKLYLIVEEAGTNVFEALFIAMKNYGNQPLLGAE